MGYEWVFYDSMVILGEVDMCGYCGKEFGCNGLNVSVIDEDWEKWICYF